LRNLKTIKVQSKTEEIIVKSLDGNVINLREIYWGKPLLILFFNIQCLGCVGRAIPLAYDYLQEFKNLNVIAIHTTFGKEVVTKDDIINIFTHKELPFPIYFDIEKTNYEKFEGEGTPHWILMDKEGNVTRSIFGSQDGSQTRLIYALEELQGSHNERSL
jgi:thiol-disulfide isomerase/thioredoxin